MAASRHGVLGRLTLGVSGQALSRLVGAANTILLVPVLIHAWGVSGYGQWIALTALGSYLGYSNFGLVTTSVFDMVMATGAKDNERARRTFQMSVNMAIYVVGPIILVALGGFCLLPIAKVLRLEQIGQSAAVGILAFVAAQIWFQTLRGLMAATLYASGSYGFAYYIASFSKLLELVGIAGVVTLLHGTQISAAAITAATGALDLLIVGAYAYRIAPWARIDLRVFEREWVIKQIKPTLGLMTSVLAVQGVLVQGPRVVLSILLGGPAVAIYAVYATATRLLDQIMLMLILPLQIEIARSVGQGSNDTASRLIAFGTQAAWILFLGVAGGLLLFGPVIFHVWTHDRIAFSYGLMALFLAMSACTQLGRMSWQVLVSTNQLYGVSFVMLGCTVSAVLVGGVLTIPFKVSGMVTGSILGELLNSIVVIVVLTRWLGKPVSQFFFEMFDLRASIAELRARLARLGPKPGPPS